MGLATNDARTAKANSHEVRSRQRFGAVNQCRSQQFSLARRRTKVVKQNDPSVGRALGEYERPDVVVLRYEYTLFVYGFRQERHIPWVDGALTRIQHVMTIRTKRGDCLRRDVRVGE